MDGWRRTLDLVRDRPGREQNLELAHHNTSEASMTQTSPPIQTLADLSDSCFHHLKWSLGIPLHLHFFCHFQ